MNQQDNYNPFVSIAMTTFNSEKYMRQQVDSLLNQTYKNFELVVSDDLSKDETVKILDEYVVKKQPLCEQNTFIFLLKERLKNL